MDHNRLTSEQRNTLRKTSAYLYRQSKKLPDRQSIALQQMASAMSEQANSDYLSERRKQQRVFLQLDGNW